MFFMNDFYLLYAKGGIISYDIMISFSSSTGLNIPLLSDFIIKWTTVSEETSYNIISACYITLSICLICGLFTRISSLFLILLHIAIFNGSQLYSYGVDLFTSIALFYCFIFPTNAQFSLDKKIFRKKGTNPGPYRKILQIHLCIVYVSSGFVKILGQDWRTGEAVWQALHQIRHNITIPLNFV
ncbi:HTTM domain-containing protein [Parapedobacter luteus]